MEVLVNESNLLVGIYFQDVETKQIFSAYPELICIDATYKLLELRFPVYIMLVEDGNGQSEIVAVFLLMEETEQSIKSMVGIFKNHNPQWEATRAGAEIQGGQGVPRHPKISLAGAWHPQNK